MPHWLEKVIDILEAETFDLRALAELAGGNPRYFYRGASAIDVDIRGQNLEGMELPTGKYIIDEETNFGSRRQGRNDSKPTLSAKGELPKSDLLDYVQQFVREVNRVTDLDELSELVEVACHELGFEYFALVDHAVVPGSKERLPLISNLSGNGVEWNARASYFSDDPIYAASQKSPSPFAWADISKFVKLTDRQIEALNSAKEAGLGEGYTIPIHSPGEATRTISFWTQPKRELPAQSLPAAHYVGAFAVEAAVRLLRRVNSDADITADKRRRLTRRQLDCVVLAGRGKSDGDIAIILGLNPRTVHQHMEDAKRKYDVATRMQLIVRALFDSQLTFADIVN